MTVAVALVWTALVVQGPPSTPPADSAARARFVAALKTVDDSLMAVRSAAAEFRLDLAAASPDLVRARAARVQSRCAGARTAAAALDQQLTSQVYTPQARRAQESLRLELAPLTRALTRCTREWNPGSTVPADSLKSWGPYRGAQLAAAVQRYGAKAAAFRTAAGLR